MSIKYRKKPVVIEAVQYAEKGNLHSRYRGGVPDWLWDALESETVRATNGTDPMVIRTLEGEMTIAPGDWIIQGVRGEIYSRKPDIFEATYEAVAEGTTTMTEYDDEKGKP